MPEKMMLNVRTLEVLVLALLAGCAGVKETPSPISEQPHAVVNEPSLDRVTQAGHPAATPLRSEPTPPRQPVQIAVRTSASKPAAMTPRTAPVPAAPAAPPRSFSKVQSIAKAAPAPVAASPVTLEKSPPDITPQVLANPPEPTLDMTTLQARLRDTDAIGVFTKLALKNQVDTLMQQFRTHYQNDQKTNVTTLRQPYDMLVLKVLTLVQDDDPPLAKMIAGSREAIWDILADPKKFNSVI